jgi:hypothetical protein
MKAKRSFRFTAHLPSLALAAAGALLAGGCGDAPDPPAGPGGQGAGAGSLYALGSLVFGDAEDSVYVALLDSLGQQTVDLGKAREFPGAADIWVHEGALFLASDEDVTVTRFTFDGKALVEGARVSFAQLGLKSVGFWNNVFISATKAYMLNGPDEYVVWNPTTMEIAGSVKLPVPEVPAGFKAYPAYLDRTQVLRGGRLHQPIYVTDESYFKYLPESYVVVTDVEKDQVVEMLEAPCPGLDYATQDHAGHVYFSSWVYAPSGAAVLGQPPTCVAKLAAGESTISKAFAFSEVTGGHQGAALYHIAGGQGIMSILHEDHATGDRADVRNVGFGQNWRSWSYDFTTGKAALMESVDWHGGAHYSVRIDGEPLMLITNGEYTSSTVYRHAKAAGEAPVRLFDTRGWAVRLFKVR